MNSDNIRIVKVVPPDLGELREISIETFYVAFGPVNTEENMQQYMSNFLSEEKLAAELDDPDSEFYFAKMGEQVVGYLKLNFGKAQTELKEDKAVEVERIYVKAGLQGKKIGQLLFDKAIAIAKEKKAGYLWLGVWEKNQGAIKFYERNGLKQFATHPFRLGDDVQTDIMMKLEL